MAEILDQLRLVVYPIIFRVSAPSQVGNRQISAINSFLQGVKLSDLHLGNQLGSRGRKKLVEGSDS